MKNKLDIEQIKDLKNKYIQQIKNLEELEESLKIKDIEKYFGQSLIKCRSVYNQDRKPREIIYLKTKDYEPTLHIIAYLIDKEELGENKARMLNRPITKKDREDLEKIYVLSVKKLSS